MKFYNKLMRKKRAVSPIIAAILLIGLAVLAGAAIFVVVLPMLQTGTGASDMTVTWSGNANATVTGTSTSSTQTVTFSLIVANGGTAVATGKIGANDVTTNGVKSSSVSYKVGSNDVTTSGFDVGAGKSVTVTITATFNGNAVSGDIGVTMNFGSFTLSNLSFSNKVYVAP